MQAKAAIKSLRYGQGDYFWIQDLQGQMLMHPIQPKLDGKNMSGSRDPDGKLFFLSGRSGSSQVWRAAADGTGPVQVTSLPLDVNAYRLSPDASKVVVSLAVFPDCADLACTVDRTKAVADDPATGQVYDRMFVRHWDTWADGTQNHLFVVNADGSGDPVMVTRGFDGDTPSKPFGGAEELAFAPDGAAADQQQGSQDVDPCAVEQHGNCRRRGIQGRNLSGWPVVASRSGEGSYLRRLRTARTTAAPATPAARSAPTTSSSAAAGYAKSSSSRRRSRSSAPGAIRAARP